MKENGREGLGVPDDILCVNTCAPEDKEGGKPKLWT